MKKKIIGNRILWSVLSTVFAVTFIGLIIGTTYAWKYERMVNTFLDIDETNGQVNSDGQYYKSDYDSQDDLLDYEKSLCTELEGEGATLLKNDNNVLPLAAASRVSLFSRSSTDLVYGGTGSGSVSSSSAVNLRDAFELNNIRVNKDLWDKYTDMNTERPTFGIDSADLSKVSIAEDNEGIFNSGSMIRSFKDYGDAAFVVLSRTGGEGYDLPQGDFDIQSDNSYNGKDGYFALQDDERAMIINVKKYFDKVIVLVNSSNALELNWMDDPEVSVDACLWTGAVGQTGAKGVANIVAGITNPSGHLADTYAVDSHSAPSMMNNSDMLYEGTYSTGEYGCKTNYMVYSEGIYVGYRYYETRYEDTVLDRFNAASDIGTYNSASGWDYDSEVSFPFGYGLSYTTFTQSLENVDVNLSDNTATMKVKVKNTGDLAGKDVVQSYFQSDYTDYDKENNVGKSAVQLCGFAKTNTLDPNQEQTVEITVDLDEVASYDYTNKKTYFLDKGTHYFAIGDSAHDALNNILAKKGMNKTNSVMTEDGNANKADALIVQDDILFNKSSNTNYEITNQFENADANYYYGDTVKYLSRKDWEETYPKAYTNLEYLDSIQEATTANVEYSGKVVDEEVVTGANNGLKLIDLKDKDYDDEEWDQLIDQMSVEEIGDLIGVGGFGTSAIDSIVYPGTKDQDGPAGVSGAFYGGKSGMSYPSEVVLASTWNVDLLEKMGKCIGEDALDTNTVGWYAPGLNTHRSPYGGRNYEYFSEDGFLAGKLAAEEISGVKSKGVVVYAKHFALNDQEIHRHGICIFSNEQAIREVYLKPFQYAVEDGKANGIMSSFNRIGCTWTGAHKGLLTEVLRNEWGFQGSVITDYATSSDWMPLTAGLEAGNNIWLYTESGMYNANFVELAQTDKYLLQLGKESCHSILYSYVNSSAMNGYTTEVENLSKTLPWWKPTLISINVVTGLLAVASLTLLTLKIVEKKERRMKRKISKSVCLISFSVLLVCTSCVNTSPSISGSESTSIEDSDENIDNTVFNLTFDKTSSIENTFGGTLSISKDSETINRDIKNYKLFWGNDDGKLEDYTQLGGSISAAATNNEREFAENLAIPQEATKLYVDGTNRSGEVLKTKTLDLTEYKTESNLLFEFPVISDQHVADKGGNFYNKTIAAYKDIIKTSPNREFIMSNGDTTDQGIKEYYDAYEDAVGEAFGNEDPNIYYSIGNHEYIPTNGDSYENYTDLAYEYTNIDEMNNGKPYYSFQKNNSYFVVLATTSMPQSLAGNDQCSENLGEEELAWFANTMEEANKTNNPIYVFSHAPLKDTVSGSLTEYGQTWYGFSDDEDAKVKNIIKNYPQTMVFSSHTHWCFESENPYFVDSDKVSYFNTASVGYLWAGHNSGYMYDGTYSDTKGSQGLYVQVYSDYVEVKGRNFSDKNGDTNWYSDYQVIIPNKTSINI